MIFFGPRSNSRHYPFSSDVKIEIIDVVSKLMFYKLPAQTVLFLVWNSFFIPTSNQLRNSMSVQSSKVSTQPRSFFLPSFVSFLYFDYLRYLVILFSVRIAAKNKKKRRIHSVSVSLISTTIRKAKLIKYYKYLPKNENTKFWLV